MRTPARCSLRQATVAFAVALMACTGEFTDADLPVTPTDDDMSAGAGGRPPGPRGGVGGGGQGSQAGQGGTGGTPPPEPAAAPARVRRLNEVELRNSIADVFGVRDLKAARFPVESKHGSFDNQFADLAFNQDFADALGIAAEAVGTAVAANLAKVSPCDVAKNGDAACAAVFVDTVGLRAYRRPLAPEERERLLGVWKAARDAGDDHPTAISAVVETMVQSPFFVYRTELGNTRARMAPITPHETAASLSYFLTRTTPDPELLQAAASGALATPAGIASEARRLLAKPAGLATVQDFFMQWLELTSMTQIRKADTTFHYGVAVAMADETRRFVGAAWADTNGFGKLLTSPATFVNQDLAPLYGAPVTITTFQSVTLDGRQRAGFLTHGSFIASHSPGRDRSPIMLGHFVRTKLLCQTLPAPPPGVPPASTDPTLDVVTRYRQHEEDPSCAGCHAKIDAIGFGFSQYDVIGRFAPVDQGVPMDGAGHIEDSDVDGPFHGAVELATKLAKSDQVRRCFVETALSFALGREARTRGGDGELEGLPIDADSSLALTRGAFAGGDLKELFVGLTTSDAFLLRDTTMLPMTETQP